MKLRYLILLNQLPLVLSFLVIAIIIIPQIVKLYNASSLLVGQFLLLSFLLLFSIVSILLFILIWFEPFMIIFDRIYLHKNMEFGKDEKCAAVLIVKSKPNDDLTLYLNGISFLLLYFKNIDKHYKVFIYPTIEEFKNIVCKEDADELYIFEHGRRGQLKFEETPNSPLKYSEFKKYNLTKKFVGQYHCNPCKQRNILVDVLFFF